MRLIFAEYKTPTMNECEQMGREINLKKRVVQVWFQNARAKEKKSHPLAARSILFSHTANNDLSHFECSPDECLLCSAKYGGAAVSGAANSQAQRDHLFSKGHIGQLIQFVTSVAAESGAFTGFRRSGSAGSDGKRKFEEDTAEEGNESFDDDSSNVDNEENFIEYGKSCRKECGAFM